MSNWHDGLTRFDDGIPTTSIHSMLNSSQDLADALKALSMDGDRLET